MDPTRVEDDEVLFRRVPCDEMCFEVEDDGALKVQPAAFNDRAMRPSVDRRALRPDPVATQRGPGNLQGWERGGVVRLVTSAVRGDRSVAKMKGDAVETQHALDVIHKPNPPADLENAAHAQVEPSPAIASANVFRRVREALARLVSGWEIRPEGHRDA